MRSFLTFLGGFALLLAMPGASQAQEYLDQPICFTVKNYANYMILGDVSTDWDVTAGGEPIRHRANFRLQASGEEGDSYPMCTTGPLYEGGQIHLRLRTLFPVFECKTMIWQGMELEIHGKRKADDSGVETWAVCY